MLDLSKLSPMTRRKILEAVGRIANSEYCWIRDEIKDGWEPTGSINSEAGKEMVGWRDALAELRDECIKQHKAS